MAKVRTVKALALPHQTKLHTRVDCAGQNSDIPAPPHPRFELCSAPRTVRGAFSVSAPVECRRDPDIVRRRSVSWCPLRLPQPAWSALFPRPAPTALRLLPEFFVPDPDRDAAAHCLQVKLLIAHFFHSVLVTMYT